MSQTQATATEKQVARLTRIEKIHMLKTMAEQLNSVEIVDALDLAKMRRELEEISKILCQRV